MHKASVLSKLQFGQATPLAMTLINLQKEYWPSHGDRTSNPLFSSPVCYRLNFGAQHEMKTKEKTCT